MPHADPPVAARTLTMARILDASPARVHAAFTDGALLARWMATPPSVVRESVADPRPGGSYRVVVEGPEGDVHRTTGEFVELVPGRRIVQTWRHDGATGHDERPTLLTVELRPLGPDATELTLTHAQLPDASRYERLERGWTAWLAALAGLLDEGAWVHARVERRLAAPPARVFDALVDAATLGRWMAGTGELLRAETDPRPGGGFVLVVRRATGEVRHEGEYLVFDPPRRLAFTWRLPDYAPTADLVTVELRPDGDGCVLTLAHRLDARWAESTPRAAGAWERLCDAVADATAPTPA